MTATPRSRYFGHTTQAVLWPRAPPSARLSSRALFASLSWVTNIHFYSPDFWENFPLFLGYLPSVFLPSLGFFGELLDFFFLFFRGSLSGFCLPRRAASRGGSGRREAPRGTPATGGRRQLRLAGKISAGDLGLLALTSLIMRMFWM